MKNDELAQHLDALHRDDCYRVDSVLKEGAYEVTQKVYFVGSNGAEQGPYIRKYIEGDAGFGGAYQSILAAQRLGKRFRYLPIVHDCYSAGEKLAVVMEYVPGETLQEVVYRCDPSLELACDIFPRLCDAVHELHHDFTPSIIHRDLKPSNVMVTKDSLTIIDFGIARIHKDDSDEDTHRFGTRAYAPPEQFGFGQTDERSDVYALGALLYFCLSEKTLDGKTREKGFSLLNIPEPLRMLLVKATEFDPADRYRSVDELKEAFIAATSYTAAYGSSARTQNSTSLDAHHVFQSPFSGLTIGGAQENASTLSSGSAPVFGEPTVGWEPPQNGQAPGSWAGNEYAQTPVTMVAKSEESVLSKVPPMLGVIWDIFLFLAFILIIMGGVVATLNPDPESTVAAMSFPARAVSNFCAVFMILTPPIFLVCDRRPLKKFIPFFARRSLKKEILISVLVFIAGCLTINIMAQTG